MCAVPAVCVQCVVERCVSCGSWILRSVGPSLSRPSPVSGALVSALGGGLSRSEPREDDEAPSGCVRSGRALRDAVQCNCLENQAPAARTRPGPESLEHRVAHRTPYAELSCVLASWTWRGSLVCAVRWCMVQRNGIRGLGLIESPRSLGPAFVDWPPALRACGLAGLPEWEWEWEWEEGRKEGGGITASENREERRDAPRCAVLRCARARESRR